MKITARKRTYYQCVAVIGLKETAFLFLKHDYCTNDLTLNVLSIKMFMPITWIGTYSRSRCLVQCHSALAIYSWKYCTYCTIIVNRTLKDGKVSSSGCIPSSC